MPSDHDRVRETVARQQMAPDAALLEDVVARIIRAVDPERIILFGSAAVARMGPNSDLDLLVVKSGIYRRLDVMRAIRRELRGLGAAVDLVVVTPEELAQHSSTPGLVYGPALRDGRELYAA